VLLERETLGFLTFRANTHFVLRIVLEETLNTTAWEL
jgi:hypothetical protein